MLGWRWSGEDEIGTCRSGEAGPGEREEEVVDQVVVAKREAVELVVVLVRKCEEMEVMRFKFYGPLKTRSI